MQALVMYDIIEALNIKIVGENTILRFILILAVIILCFAVGRTLQFFLNKYAKLHEKKRGENIISITLRCLAKPVYVLTMVLAVGLCRFILILPTNLFGPSEKVIRGMFAIAIAYTLFHLIDIIEHYLLRLTNRTDNNLDNMLVPIIRKSLRVVIAIISTLFVAEVIFGPENIKGIMLSAGLGGMAIALAAKDTIANLFGSVNIFADRPFNAGDVIKIDKYIGTVEYVGFRSTRIKTLEGHMVAVPNSIITNTYVENISQRPAIRRRDSITITYNSGPEKAEKAVEIIKEILVKIPEVNVADPKKYGVKVYFSNFGDWSLNIYISYWVSPPDYWLAMGIHQQINLEMMRRFRDAQIEFAFPSQTIYMDGGNANQPEQ